MNVVSISDIGNSISIILDNGESAVFYPFTAKKDVYTTTSNNLHKHQLTEFKRDIKKFNWNVEKLEQAWINK
jgi:hypothetical protein